MPMIFRDFETQSNLDLSVVGTLNYVLDESTRPLLDSWALDDGPVKLWCPDLSAELVPEVWTYVKGRMWCYGAGRPRTLGEGGPPFKGAPADYFDTAAKPDGYFIAWNAAFDRHVHQQIATPDYGFPEIRIEQTLDAMAQAQASNLPGSLEWAGRQLGIGHKTLGGKSVMLRFADRRQPLPGAPEDIERVMAEKGWSHERAIEAVIEMWALYLDYSVQDTDLLRSVWLTTRPLDATEWQEYWVSERINDRGMLADLDVCRGAAAYREEEAAHVVAQIKEITGGAIAGPTFTAQINDWVYERLPDDLAEFMVKARDEEGYVTRLTGDKNVMTRLLEEIAVSDTPPEDAVIDLIEVLQFGRSSSAVKFEKILNQACDGRLSGSYVFNGAGQTGRFSSRGVQVHNLPRAFLDNELDVLDMVAARGPIERLREIGPVPSVLSKLIRPTFMAPEGKLLVWGDWSAIEARVTPWLAATRDAEQAVLQPFRESDSNPDLPDVYILNAAQVFNVYPDVLWERYRNGDAEAKAYRQGGKVMVLSLGFRGSVGALKAMARGYNIKLTNEEAKVWVDGWRDRNRWNKRFGVAVEEAAFAAMTHPMAPQKAGRLTYQYAPDLMGGTLVCFLPDMRPIVYPLARIQKVEKFGKEVDAITYLNGMGRRHLWDGLQIENCLAGDTKVLTRRGIVRLDTVQRSDLLWDGIEWVSHSKLIAKGDQPVIDKWGVRLTADHLVRTNDGWKKAEDCSRSDRADVWLPDDVETRRSFGRSRQESNLVGAMRLWERARSAYRWIQKQSETIANKLRLQNQRTARRGAPVPRYVSTSGVLGVAFDGRSLHSTNASSVEKLRWARDHGLPPVDFLIRDLLDRDGPDVSDRATNRAEEQPRELRAGELRLGNAPSADAKHPTQPDDRYTEGADAGDRSFGAKRHRSNDTVVSASSRLVDRRIISPAACVQPSSEEVYDILNCGPRNRFTVFDSDGVPFLVHNCTQATAASLLRQTLVRLEAEEIEAEIVLHTHDEVGGEVPEASASAFSDRLHGLMVRGFDWSEGLPLAAEVSTSWYYTKAL